MRGVAGRVKERTGSDDGTAAIARLCRSPETAGLVIPQAGIVADFAMDSCAAERTFGHVARVAIGAGTFIHDPNYSLFTAIQRRRTAFPVQVEISGEGAPPIGPL